MIEFIGVLGSVFVLIGFIFKEQIKIRIVNMIGAFLFVVYGLLISAFSVWFLNGALILVHIYHLLKGRVKRGKSGELNT